MPDDQVNNCQIEKITYVKTHDPQNRPWRIGKARTWGHNGYTITIIEPLRTRDVALEDETIQKEDRRRVKDNINNPLQHKIAIVLYSKSRTTRRQVGALGWLNHPSNSLPVEVFALTI